MAQHFAEKIGKAANKFGRKYETELKLGKKVLDVAIPIVGTAANMYGIYKTLT